MTFQNNRRWATYRVYNRRNYTGSQHWLVRLADALPNQFIETAVFVSDNPRKARVCLKNHTKEFPSRFTTSWFECVLLKDSEGSFK